jgi:Spy/CpxP family protein refolding chaperone
MKKFIWIFALLMSAVPSVAQDSDEAGLRDSNIGGQFALGNLTLRDTIKRVNDPVGQLKDFFTEARLPMTKEQERNVAAVVEAQQKDMQAILDHPADGGSVDTTRNLNQEYLKRVNTILTPEQQSAWRHYRVEQIRLRGGFPVLKLILEDAGVPLSADGEKSIQEIFENFAARRTRLTESNPNPGVAEIDRLVYAEFNRVVALLTPDQRRALQSSRQVRASANIKR